ncbi:MAG: MOSC N-terminal beta barrel domain-containing protein [Geodermatophilaceae bacterium]|nr:MOSC N-terminal beta barrel domain-containing protein [Geodermatophilaceae bacterium]
MSESAALGTVSTVWVYPVKSLAGTSVEAAQVGPTGLEGDRTHSVVDASSGEPITAKEEPRLRELSAAPGQAHPAIRVPNAEVGEQVPAAALSGWLDRPVDLAVTEADGGHAVDAFPVHLVSEGAMLSADPTAGPEACDVNDPRANLVLKLDAEGAAERGWVGQRIRVGEAVLSITRTPKHCLGVYAEVVTPGRVAAGDPVCLVD